MPSPAPQSILTKEKQEFGGISIEMTDGLAYNTQDETCLQSGLDPLTLSSMRIREYLNNFIEYNNQSNYSLDRETPYEQVEKIPQEDSYLSSKGELTQNFSFEVSIGVTAILQYITRLTLLEAVKYAQELLHTEHESKSNHSKMIGSGYSEFGKRGNEMKAVNMNDHASLSTAALLDLRSDNGKKDIGKEKDQMSKKKIRITIAHLQYAIRKNDQLRAVFLPSSEREMVTDDFIKPLPPLKCPEILSFFLDTASKSTLPKELLEFATNNTGKKEDDMPSKTSLPEIKSKLTHKGKGKLKTIYDRKSQTKHFDSGKYPRTNDWLKRTDDVVTEAELSRILKIIHPVYQLCHDGAMMLIALLREQLTLISTALLISPVKYPRLSPRVQVEKHTKISLNYSPHCNIIYIGSAWNVLFNYSILPQTVLTAILYYLLYNYKLLAIEIFNHLEIARPPEKYLQSHENFKIVVRQQAGAFPIKEKLVSLSRRDGGNEIIKKVCSKLYAERAEVELICKGKRISESTPANSIDLDNETIIYVLSKTLYQYIQREDARRGMLTSQNSKSKGSKSSYHNVKSRINTSNSKRSEPLPKKISPKREDSICNDSGNDIYEKKNLPQNANVQDNLLNNDADENDSKHRIQENTKYVSEKYKKFQTSEGLVDVDVVEEEMKLIMKKVLTLRNKRKERKKQRNESIQNMKFNLNDCKKSLIPSPEPSRAKQIIKQSENQNIDSKQTCQRNKKEIENNQSSIVSPVKIKRKSFIPVKERLQENQGSNLTHPISMDNNILQDNKLHLVDGACETLPSPLLSMYHEEIIKDSDKAFNSNETKSDWKVKQESVNDCYLDDFEGDESNETSEKIVSTPHLEGTDEMVLLKHWDDLARAVKGMNEVIKRKSFHVTNYDEVKENSMLRAKLINPTDKSSRKRNDQNRCLDTLTQKLLTEGPLLKEALFNLSQLVDENTEARKLSTSFNHGPNKLEDPFKGKERKKCCSQNLHLYESNTFFQDINFPETNENHITHSEFRQEKKKKILPSLSIPKLPGGPKKEWDNMDIHCNKSKVNNDHLVNETISTSKFGTKLRKPFMSKLNFRKRENGPAKLSPIASSIGKFLMHNNQNDT